MSKTVKEWIEQRELEKDLSEKKVITLEQHEEEIQHIVDKFTIISSILMLVITAIFLFVWFSV